MIDLVLRDRKIRERVEGLRMGDSVESDHQPVEVWVKGGRRIRRERREKKKG